MARRREWKGGERAAGRREWKRGENGGEDENREEMVHDSEATPNLMASTLKQPSCSTSLHVIKYCTWQ